MDLNVLEQDIDLGLYFKSNIPEGYGLGSSGALIAALFSKYGNQTSGSVKEDPGLLLSLKNYFGELESFFHGKSSGLDPLISFLDSAVKLGDDGKLSLVEPEWPEGQPGAMFLIDSGVVGETGPLVRFFKEKYQHPDFKKLVDERFTPLVNKLVGCYLDQDRMELLRGVKELSSLQLSHLEKMIPESMRKVWRAGLEADSFYLKLCGSGGGGMVLGFTNNWLATNDTLNDLGTLKIHSI